MLTKTLLFGVKYLRAYALFDYDLKLTCTKDNYSILLIAHRFIFKFMFKNMFFRCVILGIVTTNSCVYQTHKQCIDILFASDYMCSKHDLCKDVTIDRHYECELSQLNALLEKELKKLDKEYNNTLIEFLTPSHSFYLELTKKGNGYLYIPVSQTQFFAIKVYDSCDDTYIFTPHQASICIKDINQDGLLDIHIKFNLRHLSGTVYCINRFFLQKDTGFCELIE